MEDFQPNFSLWNKIFGNEKFSVTKNFPQYRGELLFPMPRRYLLIVALYAIGYESCSLDHTVLTRMRASTLLL